LVDPVALGPKSPDAHLGSNRTALFSEFLFAIIGQSALTVAPNFAIKFFSTDRGQSLVEG
jgi:hypothetical protein